MRDMTAGEKYKKDTRSQTKWQIAAKRKKEYIGNGKNERGT